MSLFKKEALTVDAIVADFTQKVEQLKQVATESQATADAQDAIIAAALDTKEDALAEKDLAERVAAKIAKLLD